jgi:F-type H+-transporting ATPase subunit b
MLPHTMILAAEGEAQNPLLPAIYDIIWSIIPFALVLLLFWRVILPRLQTVLDERSKAIEGGIEDAQSAQKEAQEALEKYTKLLADARDEAADIRDEARSEGQKILAEMKQQAQAEADRIAQNAQTQIEAERQAALVSLRKEVGSLALDLAGAVVRDQLGTDKKAKAVVDSMLADLDSAEKGTTKTAKKASK